jgi:hypothetical protein
VAKTTTKKAKTSPKKAAKITPKKAVKSAPQKKKTTTKKAVAKVSAPQKSASLGQQEQSDLLALSSEYEQAIDASVSDVLQEAREIEAVVKTHGTALHKKSDLDPNLSASVAARRKVLDACEGVWFTQRIALTPEEKRTLRQEAETLKRDAVASLRFFLRKNNDVQRKVSAIQEGTGLADLLDDLSKLADLLEEHQVALAKADLPGGATPADAALRAREIEELLGETAATEKTSQESAEKHALRNRAFWFLREAMDEIRAAGRYVFRNQPKLLSLFRATRSKRPSNPKEEPPKTPVS